MSSLLTTHRIRHEALDAAIRCVPGQHQDIILEVAKAFEKYLGGGADE